MFTTLDETKIKIYVESLKSSNLPNETILKKLESLEKFLDWVNNKGHITESQYDQISQYIAKIQKDLKAPSPSTEHKIAPTTLLLPLTPKLNDLGQYSYRLIALPIIILLVLSLSLLTFLSTKKNTTSTPIAKEATLPQFLSFKGVLSDSLGNPITSKTDVYFKLYSKPESGTLLYEGNCVGVNGITPSVKGEFGIKIGSDCGMESLPKEILSTNPNLYLGISVGKDKEMKPRRPIANVGFASNANTLQGLPTGESSSSIPYINEEGDLLIRSETPGIKAISESSSFTLASANDIFLQSANSGDVVIQATGSGNLQFRTRGSSNLDNKMVLSSDGHLGIGTNDPSLFALQISGNVGPSFTSIYDLGSRVNQWGSIYGQALYQNGNEVCDSSNNCSTNSSWSGLKSPLTNLNLDMGNYTSTFKFGTSFTSADLFTVTDTANNKGTGYLFNITTAAGSTLKPFHIVADGAEAVTVLPNGNMGLGHSNPSGKLHAKISGSKTANSYSGYFENHATNNSTNEINKYGLYVSSVGDFLGSTGNDTTNYGIYIASSSGADKNYDIYAASGAYLSTGGTWTNASSRKLKTNFSSVNSEDVLAKINQLSITQWNYKNEDESTRHIGPIAEEFYEIFKLGNNGESISTIDPAGVALAGIQALDKKISAVDKKVSESYIYSGDVKEETESGFTSIQKGIIDSLSIAKGITLDRIEVLNANIDKVVSNVLTAREKIESPLVETATIVATEEAKLAKVSTNQFSPLSDNITINLNKEDLGTNTPQKESSFPEASKSTNKNKLAQLLIKGLDNKVVTTIDGTGNIITSGDISAQNASISGTLVANALQTESLQATNASFSGELVADSIKSKELDNLESSIEDNNKSISDISSNINDVQKLLADIKNQPSTPLNNYSTPPSDIPTPSPSASSTSTTDTLTASELNITNNANLHQATITDSLMIGNLIVRDNTVSSFTQSLNFSALASVTFFDDAVVIAKDGSITTKGTIIAQGGVKTDTIEPATGTELNIKGAKLDRIAVDTYLDATSSATIVAAADNLSKNGIQAPAIETTTETAGVGILPKESTEVLIYNNSIKDGSLIYLTPTSPLIKGSLTVVQKESCSTTISTNCKPYFKVGINESNGSDISFNWLTIN